MVKLVRRVTRMGASNACKIVVGTFFRRNITRRLRLGEDNTEVCPWKTRCGRWEWIQVARNKIKRRDFVHTANNIRVL